MATVWKTTAKAGAPEKNDGATIANAGKVSATSKNNNAGFGVVIGVASGGTPKPTEQTGTVGNFSSPGKEGRITARGSGTFAYDNKPGRFIGIRLASWINGTESDSILTSGSAKGAYRGSIHALETYYTKPFYVTNPDGSYSSESGTSGVETNYIDPAISGGATASTDSAANPTRAIPGELVYSASSLAGDLGQPLNTVAQTPPVGLAKQADYPAKTG